VARSSGESDDAGAVLKVAFTDEKKEYRVMPSQVKKCVTLYDKTTRFLRKTEYIFYHFDGESYHVVFLRGDGGA
jgi:hypothetical protein